MHSFEASTKELKCVITAESIKYGFDILQGIQNENRSERVNEDKSEPDSMEINFNVIAACVTAAHSPIREILEKEKKFISINKLEHEENLVAAF
ncbi:hypothetical protein KIW84_058296 [Lathyrus oleraceus]|uniref:Uncharacterized protein n=1 Tax=Pisum sativum TaxID=3888 RepID=A0A9D5AM73_PEA|nr:hypothetical protein KIW84_058296 [Pisum sativum]